MSAGIRKWAVYVSIWVITPLFFGFCTGIVYSSDIRELIGRISDCFFASGMMLSGVGVLLFASGRGLFDMFGYGMKKLIGTGSGEHQTEDFLAYRSRKRKKRTAYSRTLFAGVVFIGISVIGCLLWYAIR